MRCLVFGGGGFIGSAVVDRLLVEGFSLRIFERPGVKPHRNFSSTEDVEWLFGDILSSHDVAAAMDGVDIVIHLVSTTLPKSSSDDPVYDVQSNLVGTLQMLNAMVEKKVGRIIFVSSGGTVYGAPQYLPIDERHPTHPTVSYGVTKLAIEKYLSIYHRSYGIKPVILRVSNPYGERQRIEAAQGAVGVFLHRALNGQAIDIWGDGSITRDYVYVGDVADAFCKAIKYSGDEQIFNIGSGVGTSLRDLVRTVETVLALKVTVHHHPARIFDVQSSILSNALAMRELGWEPRIGLEDGIQRAVSWLQSRR